jgi:hypothetical protein
LRPSAHLVIGTRVTRARARLTALRVAALALAVLASGGCVESPSARRNVGEDCGSCHREGGKAPEVKFTAAGTVFAARTGPPLETGAGELTVVLRDAEGRTVELATNPAGNFYSTRPLRYPVQVEVRARDGTVTRSPAGCCSQGSCNACHLEKAAGGAHGRLLRP